MIIHSLAQIAQCQTNHARIGAKWSGNDVDDAHAIGKALLEGLSSRTDNGRADTGYRVEQRTIVARDGANKRLDRISRESSVQDCVCNVSRRVVCETSAQCRRVYRGKDGRCNSPSARRGRRTRGCRRDRPQILERSSAGKRGNCRKGWRSGLRSTTSTYTTTSVVVYVYFSQQKLG